MTTSSCPRRCTTTRPWSSPDVRAGHHPAAASSKGPLGSAEEPGNLIDDPAARRGPARLPLKPKAWNRVELTIKGDTLSLRLNGEPAYEAAIEPTNPRDFGLFHYADETEARIRNVNYRGQWPRTLPPGLLKN